MTGENRVHTFADGYIAAKAKMADERGTFASTAHPMTPRTSRLGAFRVVQRYLPEIRRIVGNEADPMLSEAYERDWTVGGAASAAIVKVYNRLRPELANLVLRAPMAGEMVEGEARRFWWLICKLSVEMDSASAYPSVGWVDFWGYVKAESADLATAAGQVVAGAAKEVAEVAGKTVFAFLKGLLSNVVVLGGLGLAAYVYRDEIKREWGRLVK